MTWADQISEWFNGAVGFFFLFVCLFYQLLRLLIQVGKPQSILWMCLSWPIGIYTLEKLTSGWSPSARPLLGRCHILGRTRPAGVFEFLGGCFLIGKWDKRRPTTWLIVVWRPVPLKELSSHRWRAFSPKWVAACKELTNFHWRIPDRKRSPSFGNTSYDLLESPQS